MGNNWVNEARNKAAKVGKLCAHVHLAESRSSDQADNVKRNCLRGSMNEVSKDPSRSQGYGPVWHLSWDNDAEQNRVQRLAHLAASEVYE